MQAQILDLFETKPSFENFITSKNEIVVQSIYPRSQQFTNLSGISGSGKTHLLKAWVNHSINKKTPAIYLDSINNNYNINELLKFGAIAIDNIDKGNNELQIQLFDLFNKIKLGGLNNLLLTSSTDRELLQIREDLRTRILSGLNLNLKALNDHEILSALTELTIKEGIGISQLELKYLISHHTRNIGLLVVYIRKIAEIALINNKNITIPFIKQNISVTLNTQ